MKSKSGFQQPCERSSPGSVGLPVGDLQVAEPWRATSSRAESQRDATPLQFLGSPGQGAASILARAFSKLPRTISVEPTGDGAVALRVAQEAVGAKPGSRG